MCYSQCETSFEGTSSADNDADTYVIIRLLETILNKQWEFKLPRRVLSNW
jgi:hypothetical protein